MARSVRRIARLLTKLVFPAPGSPQRKTTFGPVVSAAVIASMKFCLLAKIGAGGGGAASSVGASADRLNACNTSSNSTGRLKRLVVHCRSALVRP